MNSQRMKVSGQFGKLPEILTSVDFHLKRFTDSFLMGADRTFWTRGDEVLGCEVPSPMLLYSKNKY